MYFAWTDGSDRTSLSSVPRRTKRNTANNHSSWPSRCASLPGLFCLSWSPGVSLPGPKPQPAPSLLCCQGLFPLPTISLSVMPLLFSSSLWSIPRGRVSVHRKPQCACLVEFGVWNVGHLYFTGHFETLYSMQSSSEQHTHFWQWMEMAVVQLVI